MSLSRQVFQFDVVSASLIFAFVSIFGLVSLAVVLCLVTQRSSSSTRHRTAASETKGAFFNSQFWNENGQNVKCALFSIPHSYSGMARIPFHPFCSQGQNEQNVANENPRWLTAR